MKIKIDDALEWIGDCNECDKKDIEELKWLKENGYKDIWYDSDNGDWVIPDNEIFPEWIIWRLNKNVGEILKKKKTEMCEKKWRDLMRGMREKSEVNEKDEKSMNRKKEFGIKEVIELVGDCDDCTAEDYMDLCELEECGYEIVRFVRDVYEDYGGCWILEKKEYDVERDIHGGLFVKLSDRVCEMLDRVCEGKNDGDDKSVRNEVEDLMYRLNEGLNKWDCIDISITLDRLKEIFENEKRKK